MRYFTTELIRALSGDPAGAEGWAAEEWARQSARYREELDALRPKLPERLAAFIDQGSLYEYHLERLELGGGTPDPLLIVRNALEVVCELSFGEDKRRLIYRGVSRVAVALDGAAPLLRGAEPPRALATDTWLYDEISAPLPGRVRHEVLLASGGIFSIDFEGFDFAK
jgi:hypothetical protein